MVHNCVLRRRLRTATDENVPPRIRLLQRPGPAETRILNGEEERIELVTISSRLYQSRHHRVQLSPLILCSGIPRYNVTNRSDRVGQSRTRPSSYAHRLLTLPGPQHHQAELEALRLRHDRSVAYNCHEKLRTSRFASLYHGQHHSLHPGRTRQN
jgi:hypothetical protein